MATKQQLQELQKLLDQLEKKYKSIKRVSPFDGKTAKEVAKQFNSIKDATDSIEVSMKGIRQEILESESGLAGLKESFQDIGRELGKINDPLKNMTKGFNKVRNFAEELSDIQYDLTASSIKQTKDLKAKVNLEFNRLKRQAEFLKKQIASGKLTDEELSKAEELLEFATDEAKLFQEKIGYQDNFNKALDQTLKQQKNINKATGLSGKILGGLGGFAEKIGFKGVSDDLDGINDKMKEKAVLLTDNGKKTASLSNMFSIMGTGIAGLASSLADAFTDPLVIVTMIVKAVKFLVGIFDHVLKVTNQIGQGFGVAGAEAAALKAQIHAAGDASGDMFYFTEEIFGAMQSLNQVVGQQLKFNEKNAKTFLDMTMYMGLSTEQAGKLFKLSAESGVPFENIYDNVVGTTQALNEGSGFSMSTADAIDRITNSSASVRFNIKGGTEGLVRAAHTAARLGTTMDEIAAAAKTHLDFESSIAKEIEAEMFLQKDLNLDKLRAAALTGDTETAAKEQARLIRENMGSLKGNVMAQEAFAATLGISTEQLAEQMQKQEELKGLSGEQLEAKLAEQEAMATQGKDAATFDRTMQSAVKQLKAALEPLAKKIGPLFLNMAQALGPTIEAAVNFLSGPLGKIVMGVAGGLLAIKAASSLASGVKKMFGGILERGASPLNPDFVHVVNQTGGGGGMDFLGRTLGKRGLFGGKMFKGLSKVFGGKNTFIGKQLRNLAAMNLKRSSFMNQVVANNKTLSKLVPSMSKLTSKVAPAAGGGTKLLGGLTKTLKVLGPIGAAADMIFGGFSGASQAGMTAEQQKAAGVEVGISKAKATTLGVLTGGAEKGSMFSGALGIEKGSAADEGAGIAGAGLRGAGIGAAIGTAILPGVGTAIGAGIGGLVGTVSEGFKVFSDPNSKLRQGFDSFVSSTSEKLSGWATSAKDSILGFAKSAGSTVSSLASGAKDLASSAYSKVKNVGSNIVGGAKSALKSVGSFFGFADGGVVTSPVAGLVGEAGPEAIIPLNQAQGVLGTGEVVALLKELVSEVRKGGNVYLDGSKVGHVLALQSSQMG